MMQTIIDSTIHYYQDSIARTDIYIHETFKLIESSDNTDLWIALSAVVLTLILGLLNLYRNEKFLEKSNTPSLFIDSDQSFQFFISNNGTGNARNIRVRYIYHKQTFNTIRDLFKENYPNAIISDSIAEYIDGIDLRPGQKDRIFNLSVSESETVIQVLIGTLYEITYSTIFNDKRIKIELVCPTDFAHLK